MSYYKKMVSIWLSLSILLCGCTDVVDLRAQTFIVGMGIDMAPNNELVLTVQEIMPDGGGGGGEESEGSAGSGDSSSGGASAMKQMRLLTVKGKSLGYCFRELRLRYQKKLTLDKIAYVVIGKPLLNDGILKHIDMLIRHYEINQRVLLFMSDSSAKFAMENDKGRLLDFITKGHLFMPTYIPSELWKEYSRMTSGGIESAMISSIDVSDKALLLKGEAVLRGDRYAMETGKDQNRFMNLLVGERTADVIVFSDNKRTDSVEIKYYKKKVKVGRNRVHLDYKMRGTLFDTLQDKPLIHKQELERKFESKIKLELQNLLKETTDKGTDVLGIGEKFRQKGWDTKDWPHKIKEMEFDIQVEFTIIHGQGLYE
ncbi:hypothetical protein SY83_19740 [Paenibacillus swuensis]|uniref:Uncharacterized protein n=1 Tax=Paenibacillus swuensis TaxID=1178515 RepID=A0A172TME5_9BACL|nr:Ger(x)C family spore germination C-terminal domain-containing protein [Paenibacillus swuensis]ANE48152.1 hypothetical protein SY83_19740 [Paenibacillus swuensis]